ncbi:hypothetical protein D3C72_2170240 [compost metagenome]
MHALSQELACHDFLENQIAECDQAIIRALERLPVLQPETAPPGKPLRSPHRSAEEQQALHRALNRIMGVESSRAVCTPMAALVAPGPRETKQMPGWPVSLPCASAI